MTNETTLEKHFSDKDFIALGMGNVAYIKPKLDGGRRVFAIHTADGNEVAVVDDWDVALATVKLNDLEPVRVQ